MAFPSLALVHGQDHATFHGAVYLIKRLQIFWFIDALPSPLLQWSELKQFFSFSFKNFPVRFNGNLVGNVKWLGFNHYLSQKSKMSLCSDSGYNIVWQQCCLFGLWRKSLCKKWSISLEKELRNLIGIKDINPFNKKKTFKNWRLWKGRQETGLFSQWWHG